MTGMLLPPTTSAGYLPTATSSVPATGSGGLNTLEAFSTLGMSFSLATSALGAWFAARSQKETLHMQALDAEFQGAMADLNSRRAENDAQAELEAGQQAKALATLGYGAAKADATASAAARGVAGASVQEGLATIEYAKEADSLFLTLNSVRAANARRAQAVDARNLGALSRTSAANLRGTAGSIDPLMALRTSILSGGGYIADRWLPQRRRGY